MDSSSIGWHQGEVLSIISLLISASLGSVFLWSAVFIRWESTSYENNLGMCVRPLSFSVCFRKLGVLVILLFSWCVVTHLPAQQLTLVCTWTSLLRLRGSLWET